MASKYVEDLRDVAVQLKGQGWDFSASICSDCAERMERMEVLITEQMQAAENDASS